MYSGDANSRYPQPAGSKTFLMVDDEQAILDCISLLLEARGHRVHAVGSNVAAMQVMQQLSDEIDCLILDYSMPETNGLQLLNQFRSIGWKNPAILCSSRVLDIRGHPDAQYWPEHVLAKPYGLDRLGNAISIVLGG